MVGLIWTIIVGAIVGWLASIIMKRDARQGWVGNILVGILGAFIGGLIGRLVGVGSSLSFDLPEFLMALFGAIVLCGFLNYTESRRIR